MPNDIEVIRDTKVIYRVNHYCGDHLEFSSLRAAREEYNRIRAEYGDASLFKITEEATVITTTTWMQGRDG